MKRVLVITDDFNELTFLEALLKKLGFDVIGLQSSTLAMDKALILNPEVLILSETLRGKPTGFLLKSLVDYRADLYTILLRKKEVQQGLDEFKDIVKDEIKSPVDPEDLVNTIGRCPGVNEKVLNEKFIRLGLFKDKSKENIVIIKGERKKGGELYWDRHEKDEGKRSIHRKERFQKELDSLSDPKAKSFSRDVVSAEIKEFRRRGKDSEIKDIDKERFSFVRALFKKSS